MNVYIKVNPNCGAHTLTSGRLPHGLSNTCGIVYIGARINIHIILFICSNQNVIRIKKMSVDYFMIIIFKIEIGKFVNCNILNNILI